MNPDPASPSRIAAPRTATRELATSVVLSALPGGTEVSRVHAEQLIAGAPSDDPVVFAAQLSAAVHADREELVERMIAQLRGAYRNASPAAAMMLAAAGAEARIGIGDGAGALECANELHERAAGLGGPRWRVRAAGLTAAACALNGLVAEAEGALAEAEGIARSQDWGADRADPYALRAATVLAMATSDAERLGVTISRMHDVRTRRPGIRHLADIARAAQLMLVGEDHRALALAARIGQGLTGPGVPLIDRRAAIQLQALIFLGRTEPLTAFRMLDGQDAGGSHLPCAATTRALALLQLGDHRRVLEETRGCVRRRSEHNLLILPTTLLARALAQLRLGRHPAALRSAADAYGLAAAPTRAARLALMPRDDLEDLFRLVAHQVPEYASEVDGLRALAGVQDRAAAGTRRAPRLFGLLSARERAVADHLDDSRSLAAIAGVLNLSIHTVKTHTKSIYRKLEVASREEAVDLLARIGYYER